MKIRLIIPECNEPFRSYYCKNAYNISHRMKLIEKALHEDVHLIVTSNNFLAFKPQRKVILKKFIEREIISKHLQRFQIKIPIVIGFDLRTSTIKFNPFCVGIDAVVCYIKIDNNKFTYDRHIWECWEESYRCNQDCIKEQKKNRVFYLKNKAFGLLSCGDIAAYCHHDGELLPNLHVYLDLSHRSLNPDTSQGKIPSKLITTWNKCKYVLITHQVQKDTIRRYIKSKKKNPYPWVFPQNTEQKVEKLVVNGKTRGATIDIEIK